MITIVLKKVLFFDLSRGYQVEKINFESEDEYSYTVAKDFDAVYCYEHDEDGKSLEIYRNGCYITLYKGKTISEADLEWLKYSLQRHREVKQRREILEKEWDGIEVLNA